MHAAGHFVTGDVTGHRHEERRIAAPDVKVRSADPAHRHLDDDAVWFGRRDREFLDVVALAGTEEDCCSAGVGHLYSAFLSIRSVRALIAEARVVGTVSLAARLRVSTRRA